MNPGRIFVSKAEEAKEVCGELYNESFIMCSCDTH
jgi:hypothetical protein